jgi:hypothetical protein
MEITISSGYYYRGGEILVSSTSSSRIEIPIPDGDIHYEVWLTTNGITILTRTDNEEFDKVIDPVDKLAWFTVESNSSSLDNVEVNFVKVVEN